ncbi:unnamed protein product [Paramecium sonneborni]|uniref:Uncharacterized protein n=1 Tax=Paramecium sonneborni TaxID=65129 RepID=A0A8S1Q6V8_9CILI|nr:unnamed protein product [Paramecium sonneborni]
MNLALIYSQIQALSLIILPITSLLVIITFILQIYTLLTNRSLKQQNPVKFSRQNSDQVELDFDIQPLLNKNNDDVKQQEIQQNPKNDIDNVLKNIGRLLMIEQICDIKISVQKYDDQYQEDFKKFEQNFKDFFRNDQEKQQKVREILQQLYENTNQKRQVQEEYKSYVRPIQDEKSLKKNYSLQLQESKTLSQYCNAFREVRGDGNCFYTAFGYQFLQILLFHYSFQQFFEFIKKIKNIELSMKIFVQDINFKIDDKEIQKILLQEFVNRLIQLKSIKDINLRQESFFKQFAAYQYESDDVDGCFYGLSTIFFRNYSDYIINQSEMKETIYDREKLLQWEQECDNNETVISELAKSLNVFVELIFFGKDSLSIRQQRKLENYIINKTWPLQYWYFEIKNIK